MPIRWTTRAWVGFFLEDGGVDAQERLSPSLVVVEDIPTIHAYFFRPANKFRPKVGIFASLPTDFAPKFQLPFLGVLLHNFTFWGGTTGYTIPYFYYRGLGMFDEPTKCCRNQLLVR